MTQIMDDRGISWTAANEAVAASLFSAIDSYFYFRTDALSQLDTLLEADPECPGAWVLQGYLLMLARSAKLIPKAGAAQRTAAHLSSLSTPRERAHVAALGAWVEGDALMAQRIWDQILTDHPLDLLALRVQHFNAMFLGRPDHLRSAMTRSIADWDDATPGAGLVYGMTCMALEEVGDYDRAEYIGRCGAELEPDDLWCIHSVAHVMEAQGRLREGVDWTERPPAYWNGRGPMRHHLWWHAALFLYEAGDYDRALEFYSSQLEPTDTPGYMELSNCTALLMRLDAAGVDCSDEWSRLTALSSDFVENRVLTFTDVHALIAFAMAGDRLSFERLLLSISDYASPKDTFDRMASTQLAVPMGRALQARLDRDPTKATRILLDTRMEFARMGGSIAQRDMLNILLIDSAIAAGQKRTTRRLLSEYLDIRPHFVPMRTALESTDNGAFH